jgi:hypothetical protein
MMTIIVLTEDIVLLWPRVKIYFCVILQVNGISVNHNKFACGF